VVEKALVCVDCKASLTGKPRDLRSVRTCSGSNPTLVHVLTKRPKHPGCTAAGSLRGDPETQATLADARTVVSVSRPVTHLGVGDRGCSSIGDEEGSMKDLRERLARIPVPMPFTRRCSAHAARGSNSPRSLPPPRPCAIKRTVLASKEATPPQGVRGEGRQKAWLLGVISRPDFTRSCSSPC
jgi:hypothetical protein